MIQYGISETGRPETIRKTGLNLVRMGLYFFIMTNSGRIDKFLKAGFNVQVNFNWKPTYAPIPFCSDTGLIKQQANRFFAYYKNYIDQMPVVVIENEWDNIQYRDPRQTSIEVYLEELRIVCDIAHDYGFKVADAGFTGSGLARWYYSRLEGDAAKEWRSKYFVGTDTVEYEYLLNAVSKYINTVRNIPIDYINVHWYNTKGCFGGLKPAAEAYRALCGKPLIINEFGVKHASLWECTVQEVQSLEPDIAIAYSGSGVPGKAIKLTPEMLSILC